MKQFLITYRLQEGREDQRAQEIAAFIDAIDADPILRGKISYRSMKRGGRPEYYHIATAADEAAVRDLQSREFFAHYTAQTEALADGEVDVSPLETIAETSVPV